MGEQRISDGQLASLINYARRYLVDEYVTALRELAALRREDEAKIKRIEELCKKIMRLELGREGWKLVPEAPSPDMTAEGWPPWIGVTLTYRQVLDRYRAMLQSAPSPQEDAGEA